MKSIFFLIACSLSVAYCCIATDIINPETAVLDQTVACHKCHNPACRGCGKYLACDDPECQECKNKILYDGELAGCGCKGKRHTIVAGCCKGKGHTTIAGCGCKGKGKLTYLACKGKRPRHLPIGRV